MPSNISKYYDEYYKKKFNKMKNLDYDEDFYKYDTGSNYYCAVSQLEELLAVNPRPEVLEIGVGTGAMLHWFRHKNIAPRAIEISEFVVDSLASKGFDVRRVDINDQPIPFEEGAFDIILSLDVLEHVVDPLFFMSEVSRTLAPGGAAIISTANSRTIKRVFRLLFMGRFPWTSEEKDGWDCGHLHYFTTRDVAWAGEIHGLTTVRCVGTSTMGKSTRGWIKRLFFSVLPSGIRREFFSGTFVSVLKKSSHPPA